MNLLCITNQIGQSAPGIVFESVLKELAKEHNVYVISPNVKSDIDEMDSVTMLPTVNLPRVNWRIENLSSLFFGLSAVDYIGAKKHIRTFGSSKYPKFDCVLSLVSQQKCYGLVLGKWLSGKLKAKWAVYSVDAIPAPYPWTKSSLMRRNMGRVFNSYASSCDVFMSANPQMLKYQLGIMEDFKGKPMVLFTPTQPLQQVAVEPLSASEPLFLYTGKIYGLRRIDALMDAFRMLLKDIPAAKMVFVGANTPHHFDGYKDLMESHSIELFGNVANLSPFYSKATVLVDINADIPNDIFLSSKIANYLIVKRPVISISGANSPSENLFTEDETIIHSSHNSENIYNAMKKALAIEDVNESRDKYIEMFSVSSVCRKLIEAVS
ncbi:MAG: glycosyltransferase [Bacteroidales bacterium]|nr:glycosyltransferase [Bacteroidales bacterium]